MDIYSQALDIHKSLVGKIEICSKGAITNKEDLSLLYSPGVAAPCLEIEKNPSLVYDYTSKGNLIAIVTDGSAVLGLGDIGAEASIPVMEGKSALFKRFANVDAFPICIKSHNIDEIVHTVELISPSFGGINLEDISAPFCFEVERQLQEKLDIPVFHDDQHGTAIVVMAALLNALELTKRNISTAKIVVNGLGAAGLAIVKMLTHFGAKNLYLCDINGLIFSGDVASIADSSVEQHIDSLKQNNVSFGSLSDTVEGADVFIGVSRGDVLKADDVKAMNKDSIIFALANPTPEIMPEVALAAGARIVCTGRTDYPNQINNILAFPGIFRGALDVRATQISSEMKMAAVYAIKNIIKRDELSDTNIIPSVFDETVVEEVSRAVGQKAVELGFVKH